MPVYVVDKFAPLTILQSDVWKHKSKRCASMCARVLQAPNPHVSDGAVSVCANRYTTFLCDICISDDGCIWAGPPLVVSILYIYPFI